MLAEFAALARRHSLPPEVVADFDRLWRGRYDAPTTVEGYEPVDLPSLGDDEPTEVAPPEPTAEAELIGGRYIDLGPIGVGGMGEVRRVLDVPLNRTLAMKTLLPRLAHRPTSVARFLEEAQATAQLQHPGIVAVHDLGTLPDGRLWFTMKEVRGRTLSDVCDEVHAASRDRWERGAHGWTFRRLVAAFMQVCHAVAYAHERGVVHRDLKPHNVMVGLHGEVYVLDWGLAKVVGRREPDGDEPSGESPLGDLASREGGVVSSRTHATRIGTVAGTPAYMAPEQARGEVHQLDARTDVYALGAMLYEILGGRPPYLGATDVLTAVRAGPPEPLGPLAPDELVAVCQRAMARDAAERFGSALALAVEVEAWLDGARRREQALAVVEQAGAAEALALALAERATALRAESVALLSTVATWQPEVDKAPGWQKATEADQAELSARLKQLEVDQTLEAALRISPGLPEAHATLALRQLARHGHAEAARDSVAEAQTLLEAHAGLLPATHALRHQVAAYLKGEGALTLVTDPPGAEVSVYRYELHNRRRVEVFHRSLGVTPLHAAPLAMGSYLCVLRHPDRAEVRYPVEVTRRGHWDGLAPGEREPRPVWLPPRGYLGPDDCYVPAGWFQAGGDPEAPEAAPAMRRWCEALVVQRFPVTNRQFLVFLDDLVAQGREDEALRYAPRERPGTEGELGSLVYGYEGGKFSLRADADGDVWDPEYPVLMVDWHGARAYLAWLAARTGRPWRLPGEQEWEKAARGVDGRWFPWGDHLDASWCNMNDSRRGGPLPAVVVSFPVDTSPYGVRGLGGNARDWCLDPFGPLSASLADTAVAAPDGSADDARSARVVRGGSWDGYARIARAADRSRTPPGVRNSSVAFRGFYRPA